MEEKIAKIEGTAAKLYRILEIELAHGARRLDYNGIGKRLGRTYGAVRYNLGKLMQAKLVAVSDGKFYLI